MRSGLIRIFGAPATTTREPIRVRCVVDARLCKLRSQEGRGERKCPELELIRHSGSAKTGPVRSRLNFYILGADHV